MLSDEELLSAFETMTEDGNQLADARAVEALVRRELLREIEAIEETRPAMRANSVIPHLVGIDLGAAHQRDRQVAGYVAQALVEQLGVHFAKEANSTCSGKLSMDQILEGLAAVCVIGAAPVSLDDPEAEPCAAPAAQ